jgi:two-component system chemotaxis response regulator CheY
MKILVVDDSPSLRKVIMNYLNQIFTDCVLLEAGNGLEADFLVQDSNLSEQYIDLIVLDWMMPHMSGKDFLEKLNMNKNQIKLPKVIMLTAETYSAQMNAILKFGVIGYIKKPFSCDDLSVICQKHFSELCTKRVG